MKTPIRILARHLPLILALALAHSSLARSQDPFLKDDLGVADPENAFSPKGEGSTEQVVGKPFDPNERSAVVLSLRSNPPRTPSELARAIQLMARIRRWDEVGYWLDEVVKSGLNETNATQMVQAAGTQTFLQLSSAMFPEDRVIGLLAKYGIDYTKDERAESLVSKLAQLYADRTLTKSPITPADQAEAYYLLTSPGAKLSDLRKANARKILDLASAAANNPMKLKDSVASLRSNNKNERIQAHRYLESAGNRGVSALINHLLAEGSAVPNPTMCESFVLMGKPAFSAWQAAMTSPHADARGNLALLAARSGEPSLTTELCVAAIDQQINPSVREELAKVAADRNKSIPGSKAIYRHAIDQMQKSLKAFQKIRWMDEPDAYTTWQLATDGRSVMEKPARLADLDWVRGAQFANAAMQCGEYADSSSGLAVAIASENACRSLPDAGSTLTLANVAPRIPASLLDSYEFACLVWDGAESSNLASGQLMAVRNLARWANPTTIPNPVRERLSQACGSGFAPVRYAAAQALLGTFYTQAEDGSLQLSEVAFDGRNRLERVLSEMRMLEASPLALVVGGAADLRTHVRTLLESFGFRVLEAASAAQTMSVLREGQPIEAVFVVSHVLEMNLGDLTQRIRANPATASCPIAILAASLSRGEHEIAGEDTRVVMGSVPPEQADFADILRRMRIVTQAPLMDSTNRNAWRELSSAYWADKQSKFVSAQPKSLYASVVDTPVGQQQCIQIAIDNSRSLPQREQASQNFVQSVKQFGVMISSETVKAQYDEYNKRGPDELDLRKVLGRILDAIEAARGDRPWAEVAP